MSDVPIPGRPESRGPNYEANRRPESSKRVTFALGARAQNQADRLARVLSTYRKGGVSQSALMRALLEIAESAANQSGDPIAALIHASQGEVDVPPDEKQKADPFSVKLWERIRSQVVDH